MLCACVYLCVYVCCGVVYLNMYVFIVVYAFVLVYNIYVCVCMSRSLCMWVFVGILVQQSMRV